MLLRSASTPLLNSSLPCYKDYSSSSPSSSPEPESILHLPKSRSSSTLFSKNNKIMSKSSMGSSTQMHGLLLSAITANDEDEEEEEDDEMTAAGGGDEVGLMGHEVLTLSSYAKGSAYYSLQVEDCEADHEKLAAEVLVDDGGSGSGGGKICHGGGGSGDGGDDDDDGRGSEWSDSFHGHGSMDVYYQKMIEADPTNSLLLTNYARYLKEVRAEYDKAEEYCSRAILANSGDENALSLCADLIWQTRKDAHRAQGYFDRALEAAPNDCYVMASYARFLWEADDDDVEDGSDDARGGEVLELQRQWNS